MLLRVSIPVKAGNAAAKDGTLGPTIEGILADLKPEAAYFFADDSGQRSGSIVFDMKDPSQIPAVAEPWFLAFNAQVSLRPIMNPQDLAKAGPSIGKAAKKYGCVCQLDLAPFDTLIWPHLALVAPAGADASV
jgi:hypothetical protein